MSVNTDETMEEMIGVTLVPSQSPTFLPSAQPVTAVDYDPSSSPRSITVAIVVAAALVLCVVAAVFAYRKYKHPSAPDIGKIDTEDVENPSACSIRDNVDEDAIERDALNYAVDRAFLLFPRLLEKQEKSSFGTILALKKFLQRSVDDVLLENHSLYSRINAPILFRKLGMDEEMTKRRLRAIICIEKELGIVGKSSFVESIYVLIEYIEIKNPFGEVNEEIQTLNEDYSHMCVSMEKGNLSSSIKMIKAKLENKKLEELFMHGTRAAVPKDIVEDEGGFGKLKISTGRHDFGHGLYCFRDDIIAALSFAVDRSFPSGNPCVIAFPEPIHDIEKRILDVNYMKIKPQQLRKILGPKRYSSFDNEQRRWGGEDKNWKICVSLAQQGEEPPHPEGKILMGWLHDAEKDAIKKTRGGGEPKIDPDKWIQYCVKRRIWLGDKMIFIEFDLNWDEWDDSLADLHQDISTLWRNHTAERVNKVS